MASRRTETTATRPDRSEGSTARHSGLHRARKSGRGAGRALASPSRTSRQLRRSVQTRVSSCPTTMQGCASVLCAVLPSIDMASEQTRFVCREGRSCYASSKDPLANFHKNSLYAITEQGDPPNARHTARRARCRRSQDSHRGRMEADLFDVGHGPGRNKRGVPHSRLCGLR